MTDLKLLLKDPTRGHVTDELVALAEQTIDNQSGLTGMALKSALAAAEKVDGNAMHTGVNQLLPNVVEELEPYWSGYKGSGAHSFGDYLADNEEKLTDSVLKIGDSFSGRAPTPAQKVYSSMRSKIGGIIAPALPEFGAIIERHAE
ncbi:hypothetical protein QYQ98_05985 [Corynebacterium sp. P3-F1]|uniref:DUF6918 family protein n=1 Tax=Corynebacterium sp. P3-F1 TaxID=3059080 RepID=UPI00265CA33D|nr:hypothetical protein [Corynebacterium sp. P3-F1]WKK60614.1 hypothetical protein QYQ98_05985 [Corynebacterium sp. P3-F1]